MRTAEVAIGDRVTARLPSGCTGPARPGGCGDRAGTIPPVLDEFPPLDADAQSAIDELVNVILLPREAVLHGMQGLETE